MRKQIDSKKTLAIIEQMKLAQLGEYNRWEKIIKKISKGQELTETDHEYFNSISRIYKNANISPRSKIFHSKLSEKDDKPPCKSCGEESLYYCNMNDSYFCPIHVVGHDENEI